MSNQREEPRLPSRRSPAALDRKILDYARTNTPDNSSSGKSWLPPWWMSGLATASILAVAVLVALPPKHTARTAPELSSEAEAEAPSAAAVADAPVAKATRKANGVLSDQRRFKSPPAMESQDTAGARATARRGELSAAPQSVEKPSPDRVSAKTRQTSPQYESAAEIRSQLRELSALAELPDKLPEAQKRYAELLRQCSECDLPKTLQEALRKYELTTEPAPPVRE